MTAAGDILQRLSALGARIERRRERLVICTGPRQVPSDLVAATRSVKPALLATLSAATEDVQQEEGDRLRYTTGPDLRISAASAEDDQVTMSWPDFRSSANEFMNAAAREVSFRRVRYRS